MTLHKHLPMKTLLKGIWWNIMDSHWRLFVQFVNIPLWQFIELWENKSSKTWRFEKKILNEISVFLDGIICYISQMNLKNVNRSQNEKLLACLELLERKREQFNLPLIIWTSIPWHYQMKQYEQKGWRNY